MKTKKVPRFFCVHICIQSAQHTNKKFKTKTDGPMGYNWQKRKMKKVALLFLIVLPLLMTSCQKEDTAWFTDNGWVEGILEYGNSYGGIGMKIDENGNISGIFKVDGYYYNHSESWWEFRLCSSLDQLKELNTAPSDGYVGNFLCDDTKCGVARNHTRSWSNGPGTYSWYGPVNYTYYKFYIRRINSYQFRVYVKEWYSESLD